LDRQASPACGEVVLLRAGHAVEPAIEGGDPRAAMVEHDGRIHGVPRENALDFRGNGNVGTEDLLMLPAAWEACPS
jgi:hypothetical protein